MTHICVGKLTIIGSDNGLSPGRRQAIIWTNAGILLIGPLGTNFSEISIEIHTFSVKEMHLKISSGKWRPFCLGLNVLTCTHAIAVTHEHPGISKLLQLDCLFNSFSHKQPRKHQSCTTEQIKHQSCTTGPLVRGIHWSPVDSPHKGPIMLKIHVVTYIWGCSR